MIQETPWVPLSGLVKPGLELRGVVCPVVLQCHHVVGGTSAGVALAQRSEAAGINLNAGASSQPQHALQDVLASMPPSPDHAVAVPIPGRLPPPSSPEGTALCRVGPLATLAHLCLLWHVWRPLALRLSLPIGRATRGKRSSCPQNGVLALSESVERVRIRPMQRRGRRLLGFSGVV